jgi:hypothetical protein
LQIFELCKNSEKNCIAKKKSQVVTTFKLYTEYEKNMGYFKLQEELENTKGVIRICISKDRQHNDQKKKDKGTTTIYKIYI